MVGDFQAMKSHIRSLADEYASAAAMSAAELSVDLREAEGLLRWLCDDNYVIFSVEEYDRDGSILTRLGTAAASPPERDADLLRKAGSEA